MVVQTYDLPYDSEFLKYNKIEFLLKLDIEPTTYLMLNAMSVIAEDEPYISIDLTLFKSFYHISDFIPYAFFPNMLKKSVGYEIYDDKLNGKIFAPFSFVDIDWDNLPIVQYSALCLDDPNGAGCEIEYPAPEINRYYLIQYPNRDGISITGRGFLAELIEVEKGKSLIYSKTYNQSIQLIRSYAYEEVIKRNVHIKNIDNNNAAFIHMITTRTFAIFDNEERYLPFSRKHVESDIMSFLDEIGVFPGYFSYFINDENGCIIF